MEQFIVRHFLPADFNQIAKLWTDLELGNPERGDNLEIIEQTLNKGGCLLVLENTREHKIIGTSWITNDGRRLYLHHFGVAEEYQGLGLAKSLLNESLVFAKKTNLQIKLEVGNKNIKALNLYHKGGFKPLGDYQVLIIRKYD